MMVEHYIFEPPLLMVNFENWRVSDMTLCFALSIISAWIIGYQLKIKQCNLILFTCIFMVIISLLYTYFLFEETGSVLMDIATATLPTIILVGFMGAILIFRDVNEMIDLKMINAIWCIWGSGFIGVLTGLKLYDIFLIVLLLVLTIKISLQIWHDYNNRHKIG